MGRERLPVHPVPAARGRTGKQVHPTEQPTEPPQVREVVSAVVGAGYVGMATAVALAETGHRVLLVERSPEKLRLLEAGQVPMHEPELPEAYAAMFERGRILPMPALPASPMHLVIICVGTPVMESGLTDTAQVEAALTAAVPAMAGGAACVIRSTLPVGSSGKLARMRGVVSERLFVAPEFMRQGSALEDVRHPTRVVIGSVSATPDAASVHLVATALTAGEPAKALMMRAEEASLVKNGSNVYLAMRLSFANEVAALAEDLGVDVGPVLAGISLDPRIGPGYFQPGFGFGGSCLPKEVSSLSAAGLDLGLPMYLARAIASANDDHQRRFARRIAVAVGGLSGKRIALLGLAFKADTDDVRSSPALRLAARLLSEGADVRAHDPAAGAAARRALPNLQVVATPEEAVRDASAAVIATEWAEYRNLDWASLRPTMKHPLILDGRRLLPATELRAAGFTVIRVGDGLAGD